MVKKVLKIITVTFREDERYLRQIEFQEVSGDSTLITLENTVLNPVLDDSYFIVDPGKKKMSGSAASSSPPVSYVLQDGQGAG